MKIFIAIGVLAVIFIVVNYQLSMKWLKINEIKISGMEISEDMKGFKILHISDIHNGSESKISFDFWDKIYDLDYDIAVITGDMTVSHYEQILPLREPLKKLTEKTPVFFVDGNHEKGMLETVQSFMSETGAVVLANEKTEVLYNNTEVSIIGLRDSIWLNRTGYEAVYRILEENEGFNIVLEHQPQVFDKLLDYEHILMLSGHTHGGQVRIPLMPTLYAPGQGFFPKYGDGLYTGGNSRLYISKGIGTTIFPLRFFNRPEIAIIELS